LEDLMKALKITAGVLAVLAAAVLVFIAFFLPEIVKNIALKQVAENTGRKVTIDRVAINPFGMTLEVRQLQLKERDGVSPFVSFSSVRASVSMSSVWKRAVVMDQFKVAAPNVHVVRTGPNEYNFTDILKTMEERKKKEPQKKESEMKFSINNIALSNGRIVFDDRGVSPETTHKVEDMALTLPFISTIPYMAKEYITPSFYAKVNGSPLGVKGMLRKVEKSVEASVAVRLSNVDIPSYHPYFPGELPVKPDSGKVSTDVVVAYTTYPDKKPELTVAGNVALNEIFLRDRTNEPIFALRKGEAGIHKAWVTGKRFDINTIDLDGFQVWLSRDRKGAWSHSRLTTGAKKEVEKPAKGKEEKEKIVANVTSTSVANGTIHFRDDFVPGGFSTDVQNIAFRLGGYSTLKDHNAPFVFSFATAKGIDAKMAGDLEPDPLEFNSNVQLTGIQVKNYYPYLADYLKTPVKGEIAVSGNVHFDKPAGLRTEGIDVDVKDIAADFGGRDGAKLSLLSVKNVVFDQKKKDLSVGKVLFDDGSFRVTRFKDGKISAMNILKAKKKGSSIETKKKKPGESDTFKYRIADLELKRLGMNFKDQSPPKEAKFRLRGLHADLKNLTGPKFETMPFSVATGYAEKGRVEAKGTIRPEPLKLKISASVGNIPVKDFNAYMPQKVNVVLADGKLTAKVSADVAKKGEQATGTFDGNVSLRSFQANDAVTGARFLAWESIDLRRMKGALGEPFRLYIDELVLNEYYADVAVDSAGNMNLAHLVKKEPEEKTKKEEKKGPPPDIRINTITLENGVLGFSDQHLQPAYSTKFVKLGGRISGLTSEPGKTAGVDLRGALENHSPLRISGEMNPLSDPAYLNLKVNFDDIELPRLTPYSATYLGYRINQGKLNLDLRYRVEGKKLAAENRIFIDQLTFGQKVASEKATNLPVPMAVGLLKDKKGEINLDVPVTGRTDDPKFGVWDVVKEAFQGFFAKLFTNPFAGLFGGKGVDFGRIYFAYGSWKLSDAEKQKLDSISGKMEEHPGLLLDVMGFVDRDRDPEPYRNQLFINKLRFEKFMETLKGPKEAPDEGQIPESVQVAPGEYSKYLRLAYRRAAFPKPKDASGRERDLPDEEMKKLMLAHTIVDDPQLRELSRLRSLSVRDYLALKGVSQERLFLKMGDIYRKPEGEVPTAARVEFSLPTGKTKEKE
jgi:hypothetical protein